MQNNIPEKFELYIREGKHQFNVLTHSLRFLGLKLYVKSSIDARKVAKWEEVLGFKYNADNSLYGYQTNILGIVLVKYATRKIK
tara:strand:- start:10791 stop:11042 length:252 start_codon:yes stop_codon:yes gene_type:complete